MNTNWPMKKLGEVAEFVKDGTHGSPRRVTDGVPLLSAKNIQNGEILFNNFSQVDEKTYGEIHKNYKIEIGDVLLTIVGSIGRTAVVKIDKKFTLLRSVAIIRPKRDILDSDFLSLLIRSKPLQDQLTSKVKQVAQPGIYLAEVKNLEIPVPGIEEQKRIVKKLEKILAKIDQARTLRQKSIEETQSVLKSALEKTFDELGKTFPKKEIKDFGEVKGGKRLPAGAQFSAVKTEYPYIRVVDFKDYSVDTSNLRYLGAVTQQEISRYTISDKDAYISIAGTIGIVGMIPPQLSGANLTENAAKIVFNQETEVNNKFIVYFLDSTQGKEEIKKRTNQVGQPKLALMRIETISVPLPDIIEQEKVVAYLDGLNEKVQALQKLQQEQLQDLEALKQSVLHQAFQGELVGWKEEREKLSRSLR